MTDRKWQSTAAGRHLAGRKSKNTAPELALRRALHSRGWRYRIHKRIAPGCTPDIVFVNRRVAIFCDGDWWHKCPIHGRKMPFTGPNAALWEAKFQRIRERDQRSTALAEEAGYKVLRVWECQVRDDLPGTVDLVEQTLVSRPPSGSHQSAH